MIALGYQGSSSEAGQISRCPHLGLQDDPETALGYPSVWNCCHKGRSIVSPIFEHQQLVCLTNQYDGCPIFVSTGSKTLPKELRISGDGGLKKKIMRWVFIGLILVFLGIVVLTTTGVWIPSSMGEIPFSLLTNPFALTPSATAIVVQIVETDTPQQKSTPDIELPPIETASSDSQPDISQTRFCASLLETPMGPDRQLILHKIDSGESMTMLANNYETTENAIDAVNYFLPSPLWAELIIVIPKGITDTSGIPFLKPVFVDYVGISLDELAEKLSVSVSDIVALNQLEDDCDSYYGWLVIPDEKINSNP